MKTHSDLIFDWNRSEDDVEPAHRVELNDETLRDGLQAAYVHNPSSEQAHELIRLMAAVGIDTVNIGLPGAKGVVKEQAMDLAKFIVQERLPIQANCAGRTIIADVDAISDVVEASGLPIETCLFVGTSRIRMDVQNWDRAKVLEFIRASVTPAVDRGLEVMFVTEDTTRAFAEDIEAFYTEAVECGATRVCVSDTVGHVTPDGITRLVRYVRTMLDQKGFQHVLIDYHGHMDRGLGIWNAIAAYRAGVNRLHGSVLGIGERVGNVPMDQLMVNLKLLGYLTQDMRKLWDYCQLGAQAVGIDIPPNYPIFGSGAFETGTGVHADAIVKALERGDRDLADGVYSGVPASWVGREQIIGVGPQSGKSNVRWWCKVHGVTLTDALADKILAAAKESDKLLTNEQLFAIVHVHGDTNIPGR